MTLFSNLKRCAHAEQVVRKEDVFRVHVESLRKILAEKDDVRLQRSLSRTVAPRTSVGQDDLLVLVQGHLGLLGTTGAFDRPAERPVGADDLVVGKASHRLQTVDILRV